MSGPKSGGYSIVDEALLRERRRAAAREVARAERDRIEAAVARLVPRVRAAGSVANVPLPPWPGEDAQEEAYAAHRSALWEHLARLEAELHAAEVASRSTRLAAALRTTTRSDARAVTAEEVLGEPVPTPEPSRSVTEDVARLLGRLRPDADRDEVEGLAERVRSDPAAAVDGRWLVDLRHAVEVANRRAEAAEEDARRAVVIMGELKAAPVSHDALEAQLREAIERRAPLDEATVEAVRELVTAAWEQADAAYVMDAAADALAELGYDVGEGFRTAVAERGVGHVRQDDARWAGHGVRVRVDGQRREVLFNVVRGADRPEAAVQDVEVEGAWCADLPQLLTALGRRGVSMRITSRLAAGELPVLEVPPEALDLPAAVTGRHGADERRARRRSRERGR